MCYHHHDVQFALQYELLEQSAGLFYYTQLATELLSLDNDVDSGGLPNSQGQ